MKLRGIAGWPAMIVAAGSFGATVAQAVDIVIEDGQFEEVTQTLADDGDTLTVEVGGTVSASGNAVLMLGASQVLDNSGLLESPGTTVEVQGADATVYNYGTIKTTGGSEYAIYTTGAFTSVYNEGDILTFGECGYGIYTNGNDFYFINNGVVGTYADNNSYGVYVEYADNATIINNGLIETDGSEADGIEIYGGNATVINNGTLRTTRSDAIGIYIWHGSATDTSITNNGTIETAGARAQAIYANAEGMVVTNSGTVISQQSDAFFMGRANQTLNLETGSVVQGGIHFSNPDSATLNIGAGLEARLTIDGMPDTITTDDQLFGNDGEVLTVLLPGLERAANTTAIEANNAISGAVRSHIGGRRLGKANNVVPLGFAATPAIAGKADAEEGYAAWSRGFGAFSSPSSSSDSLSTSIGGAVFGLDKRYADSNLVGAFVGIGSGVARLSTGSRMDTTTVVGGAYGSFNYGAAFVDVTAALGATSNGSSRRVLDNQEEGGFGTSIGDSTGVFFSPSITVGMDHDLGGLRLTPSATLQYAAIHQGSYVEGNGFTVGSQFTHVLVVNGELEVGTLRLGQEGWSASARIGSEGTFVDGRAVNASVFNTSYELAGVSSSEARGYVGVDLGFAKGDYDFSLSAQAGYSSEGVASASVHGGISLKF